ncbi:PF20097 family protein [Clostridium sp. KNHs214]|uniref:PF20097 family protein n=1 Tax=Clostridium sp. KNHs214 TaxID=1540257 RepID=UPI00054F1EE3|nr:PF20097 family protein [Clostridium sp. KNHs214]
MDCPYCNQKMEEGFIHGDRFALKWIEKSRDNGSILSMFQKGVKLTDPWMHNELEVYYCRNCKKMIIDLNDKLE